jgi:hypothetical protein
MNEINLKKVQSLIYESHEGSKNSLSSSKNDSSPNLSGAGPDLKEGNFNLWIKVSGNPKTSSICLSGLYELIKKSKEPRRKKNELYETLACNPNTPEPLLFKLWESLPAQFLQNPITELWSLTSASTIANKIPPEVQLSVYVYLIKKGNFNENNFFFPDNARMYCAEALMRKRWYSNSWLRHRRQKTAYAGFNRKQRFSLLENLKGTEACFAMDPSKDVRSLIAGFTLKEETMITLAEDKSDDVRLALAKNGAISEKAHTILSLDPLEKIRINLAKNDCVVNSNLLVDPFNHWKEINQKKIFRTFNHYVGFWALAQDRETGVRMAVAGNSKTPRLVLDILASDKDELVRSTVARNGSVDFKTYRKLFNDDTVVRQALAQNEKLTIKQRLELLNDVSHLVRDNVVRAYNGISKIFWGKALSNASQSSRETLASRSGVPGEVLLKLAVDPSIKVRTKLLERLGNSCFQQRTETNSKLVDILSRDIAPRIRSYALNDWRISTKRLKELVYDPSESVRKYLAARPSGLDLDSYGKLAVDKSPSVRLTAAINMLPFGHAWGTHNQPVSTDDISNLKSLETFLLPQTYDKDVTVRLNLAKNKYTPAELLNNLVNDTSEQVREALLCRKNFPRDIYIRMALKPKTKKLLKKDNGFCLTSNVLRHSSLSSNAYVRAMVARNVQTPIRVLRKLANDHCWLVRGQLAKNPRSAKERIAHLSKDNEKLVRQTAVIRLKKYDS